MKRATLTLVVLLAFAAALGGAEVRITPSDVYVEAVQIGKEIEILKKHLGIQGEKPTVVYRAVLKPRHSWQKTYVIFRKINLFRQKQGMPAFAVNAMEPLLSVDPVLTFEEAMRIHNELEIVKSRLGILEQVSFPDMEEGKSPLDVFNQLHYISKQLDMLNGEEISAAYVFAEAMRVFEDVSLLLQVLELEDTTYPPEKEAQATEKDALAAAFELMEEIQRLQRGAGIERTDFTPFRKEKEVTPSDVIDMVGMCLVEIQTLKATLGVKTVTPPAEQYMAKGPEEVHQLIRWTTRKLRLVRAIR